MRLLARRLWRDVGHHRAQFLSVFVMTVLTVTIFGGLDGAWRGMQAAVDELESDGAMPTLWVTATSTDEADVTALLADDAVAAADRTTTFTAIQRRADEESGSLSLTTATGSDVDVPQVIDGAPIDLDDVGGIWIDAHYARAGSIAVGDVLELAVGPAQVSLKVRGTVIFPDGVVFTGPGLISRDPTRFGQAVVTQATAEQKAAVVDTGNLVRIVGDGDAPATARRVLGDRLVSTTDRELNVFVAPAFDRVTQLRVLSLMFSTLFVLVGLLAMATAIRRLVELQHSDVATLRALGFSATLIGLYFAAIAGVVVGAGALVGVVLSLPMSIFVISTQSNEFAFVEWVPVYDVSILLVPLLLVAVCIVGAWSASRATRRLSPAEALRPARQSTHPAAQMLRGSRLAGLSYGARWAVRDAVAHPSRLAMGIVAGAGCMMLLFVGFGMPDSLSRAIDKAYDDQYRYASWVVVDPAASSDDLQQLAQTAGDGQWVMQQFAVLGDASTTRVVTVLADGELFVVRDADGTEIDLADGAAISQEASRETGAMTGDGVAVSPVGSDAAADLTVGDVAVLSQPQGVFVSQSDWESAGLRFAPTAYLTAEAVSAEQLAAAPAASGLATRDRQEQAALAVVDGFGGVFTMMKAFAVMLALVALYNLGALSFAERTRDYATLRVIGFRNGELRRLVLGENGVITAVGWLVGLPVGWWFLGIFVSIFSTFRAVYPPSLALTNLALASAITIIASLSTTFLLVRRVRDIDMTAALKGVE